MLRNRLKRNLNFVKALIIPVTLSGIFTNLAIWFVNVWALSLIFFIGSLIFCLDAFNRCQEFKTLREVYNPRRKMLFWYMFRTSKCSRMVMTSIDPESKKYYYQLGYRWYHILPDEFFQNSIKIQFWKNILHPRKF